MFHEFRKLHGTVNSVGDALDDNLLSTISFEQIMSTLEVAADSDFVLNSDFVRR